MLSKPSLLIAEGEKPHDLKYLKLLKEHEMARKIRRQGLGRLTVDTEHFRGFAKQSRYSRRQKSHSRGYKNRIDRMWCTCSYCMEMEEKIFTLKSRIGSRELAHGLADFNAEHAEHDEL